MTLSAMCLFWTQRQIDQVISDFRDLSGTPSSEPSSGFEAILSSVSLSWRIPIVLMQSLFVPDVSEHTYDFLVSHAKVNFLRTLFYSFTPQDWRWHFGVLGQFVAEAGLVPRLLHFSVQSSRRLHLTLSSHFPWDKLLHVVCLYIWLHCSRCNGCRLCQWSGFLSFTLLSVMKFASNLQAL